MTSVGLDDTLFAALNNSHQMSRIAGGYETDVYHSSDYRYAIKVKCDAGPRDAILARVRPMRTAAALFAAYLGPEHSIPNDYLLVGDDAGRAIIVSIQPYLRHARPLDRVDYAALDAATRATLMQQLRDIVQRSLRCYHETGYIPDLYGLASMEPHERHQRSDLRWLVRQGWRIAAERPLLSAHNLLFTTEQRIVLVDYDLVCRSRLTCRLYYAARRVLLWRDARQLR